MWRNLGLPVCALLACLESAPSNAAEHPDRQQFEIANPWPSEVANPLIPQRLTPALPIVELAQAETQQRNAAPDEAETSVIPADAAAAEAEKRWSDAERIYRERLAKEPEQVDLLWRLANVLAARGEGAEAARTLARAADLRPGDAALQLNASEAFGAANLPAEATRYNERALALRPTDEALLLRRARLAIWTGDNPRASETLRRLIETNPADPTLKRDLGRVLGWQGQSQEAARLLSAYVAQRGDDNDALLDLARIEATLGHADKAADLLRRYREAGGDDRAHQSEVSQAVQGAAMRAEAEKNLPEAERLYRQMLEAEPERADLLTRLSDVLAAKDRPLDAAEMLDKASVLRPDDAELPIRLSEAYAGLNRPADALRYVDQVLALRPGDIDVHKRRAKIAAWAGNYGEAAESLRALVAADPSDPTLKRDLGRVLSWQGHLNEATAALSEYLAQVPSDTETLLELARVEAMRGKSKSAMDLLERYRRAGGDEVIYRHERAALRPGAASQKATAAGPAQRRRGVTQAAPAGSPPPGIPPAGIAAEGRKRFADAERIYRDALGRDRGNVALWRRLTDVLAVQGKRREAAQALAAIADLRPQGAELQLRASEGFAFADQPVEALRYVDRALALRPDDLDLHRRRARLAGWAGANPVAEQSLRALLAADPGDLTAKRDLGQVVGWEGRADEAVSLLSEYLAQRPDDKDAWLALARNQMGRGNSAAAVEALRRYRAAGGDDNTYNRDLAMFLAWSGRPRAALALADAGLASDPADFQYHLARGVALKDGYDYGGARSEADRLAELRPSASEATGLRRAIGLAQRPYLQIDSDARWESSDGIFAVGGEMSYHHPVDDDWWLMVGGGGAHFSADAGSLGSPIHGGSSMARGFGWIGAQRRLDFATIAAARIGATATGRSGAEPTWQVSLDSRLSDEFRVQLLNLRDLHTVSPRSVSLGIMRIDTDLQLTYTPDLLWTVVAAARDAEISDGNRFLRGYLSPRRAVLRTEHWNLDLGISGNISSYREYPLQNGYYAPSFYQQYLVSTYVYRKLSDEDGLSLVVSLGAHKDETMQSFRLTTALSGEATFGLSSDWLAKLRAGYTNSGSGASRNFSAESVGLTLIRRF